MNMDWKTQSIPFSSPEAAVKNETHTDMLQATVVDEQLFRELSSLSCALDRDIFNDDESLFQERISLPTVDDVQAESNTVSNSETHHSILHPVWDSNGNTFDGFPSDENHFDQTWFDDEDESRDRFVRDVDDVEKDTFESEEAVNQQDLQWTLRLDRLILDISDDSTNDTDTGSLVRDVVNSGCGEGTRDFSEDSKSHVTQEPLYLTQPNHSDNYDAIDANPRVINSLVAECRQLPAVDFKTGIICLDVSEAQDILTTRYKLHDILIKKSVITWSRWNLADLIATPLNHSSVWKKPSYNNCFVQSALRREINKDIERRNDAIEWLIRQKDIQFQSESALFSTNTRCGTLPSSTRTKILDAGSSSWPRTKSDKTAPSCLVSNSEALNSSSVNRKESVIALSSIMEYNEADSGDDKLLMERHQSMATTGDSMTNSQCAGNDSSHSPHLTPPDDGFIHRWVRTLSKTLHRQRE